MGDKLIVIQTSDQRYMMTKYGQDLVEIDTTFNMTRDGEKLWSWVPRRGVGDTGERKFT